MNVSDRLFLLRQMLYPKHLLSALVYRITRLCFRPWKNWFIRLFIRVYQVDMEEAQLSRPEDYKHFNAFFTRALKSSSRPLALHQQRIISPADGMLSQLGHLDNGYLIQAKGHSYSTQALLGGQPALAQMFHRGSYLTLYLSPRDYHRVHMPCSGILQRMIYIPGTLFSVSPRTTQMVSQLFVRNERVVSVFNTKSDGMMAIVMIGALFVGCIEHHWHGTVIASRKQVPQYWQYTDNKTIELPQGAEMGRFNMGSTVVLLFGSEQVSWLSDLGTNQGVRMGETIGTLTSDARLTAFE